MTTHTNNVSVPGWSGAGYIVINPQTGDGAYLISGGANGAFLVASITSSMLLISIGVRNTLIKVLTSLKAIPAISTIANTLILISLILKAIDIIINCPKTASYTITGMMLQSAVILGLGVLVAKIFNPIVGYAFSFGAISLLKTSIDITQCR